MKALQSIKNLYFLFVFLFLGLNSNSLGAATTPQQYCQSIGNKCELLSVSSPTFNAVATGATQSIAYSNQVSVVVTYCSGGQFGFTSVFSQTSSGSSTWYIGGTSKSVSMPIMSSNFCVALTTGG